MIALVLIAVALLIALAFWLRHTKKRQNSRGTRVRNPQRPSDSYQSVEVHAGRDACDAVRRIGDKRFLSGEAPEIPVPGCDAAKCSCSYVHHQDRRRGDRRHRFPNLASAPPAEAGDRRTKRDRRKAAKTPSRPKTGR